MAFIAMSSFDFSKNTEGVGVVVSLILQMETLSHREIVESWD